MEENKQHIDELFRESLGNYTETPPPAVWDAVELRLGGNKRQPRAGYLRWWGWLALLLLAVGGGALIYNKYKKTDEKIAALGTVPKASAPTATPTPLSSYDSSKTTSTQAEPVTSTVSRHSDANAATPANTVAHRHHTYHNSAAAHHSQRKSGDNNIAASKPDRRQSVAAANKPDNATPVEGWKSHRNHRSAASVAARNTAAQSTVQQPSGTNSIAPAPSITGKPAAAVSRTRTLPRSRRQPAVAAATKPVSNFQEHQPETRVITPADATPNSSASQNNRNTRLPKNAPKNRSAAAVASTVRKPSPAVETPVAKAPSRVIRPKANRVIKTPAAPAASPVVSKPARPHKATAVSTVAAATPTRTTPKPPAKNRTPKPAAAPATVAITKPQREPRPARIRPSKSVAKNGHAQSDPAVAVHTPNAARNNVRTAGGQPASLEGKNEDVRFPSARPAEAVVTPKTLAVAPDVTGNPVTDDDDADSTGGGDTPYTMNSHRKHADGLGFSAGIAAGYSFGLSKPAPGEVVIAPYLQYKLSDRISLRFTPSYRFGNVASQQGENATYFQSSPTTVGRKDTTIVDTTQQPSVITTRKYFLRQQYDSILTGGSYGGRTWAIDLPVMLGYRLGGGFSIFGGPLFSYQNTVSFTSSSKQQFTIVKFDTIKTVNGPVLDTNILKQNFTHGGQPYSSYTDPGFNGNPAFRIGYFAGLRYEYRRVQAEFSIQQNLTGISNITSDAVRKIYNQPYLRFTIGYSLWEPRRRKVETP